MAINGTYTVWIRVLNADISNPWNIKPENIIEDIKWNNFPNNDFLKRWQWYFKYREALLRIKYPRMKILYEHYFFSNEKVKSPEEKLQDLIAGKKRSITKIKNALVLYEKEWNSLFPVEEDETYQKGIDKHARLESELQFLLRQQNER